jgi:hypothetical protein
MTRWAVPLDEHFKSRLTHDTLELGDLQRRDDGSEMLVFRDRFVALKVAAKVGGARPVALTRSPD